MLNDAFFRVTTQSETNIVGSTETDISLNINLITESLAVSDMKSKQTVGETEKDTGLQRHQESK